MSTKKGYSNYFKENSPMDLRKIADNDDLSRYSDLKYLGDVADAMYRKDDAGEKAQNKINKVNFFKLSLVLHTVCTQE